MTKKETFEEIQKVITPILLKGGIGVFPTDTLYGVVGSAFKKKTVERIYVLRKRDLKKPMIILISSFDDLKMFGIVLSASQKKILSGFWPGKVSVVLGLDTCHPELVSGSRSCKGGAIKFEIPDQVRNDTKTESDRFQYLHRGGNSLAFRLPDDKELTSLLKKTGPLVAPSANLAGEKPASNYFEARKYFDEKVDFYVDGGKLKLKSSTLVEMNKNGELKVLRGGAVKIAKNLIMA